MTLELNHVHVGYGGVPIIQDVTLTIQEGEFLSLIGPNGAGKTTLLNAMSGQLQVQQGRIFYGQTDITHWKAHKRSRAGIGRGFQSTHLFPNLSVLENVLLAVEGRRGITWMDTLRSVHKASILGAKEYLGRVGFDGGFEEPAGQLSHGDKRKLELCMLLAMEPTVLLLDEPTAGMAVGEVPRILDLLFTLKSTRRFAVVLVEHKLDVVMRLSDRVAVLQQGRLITTGSPAEVTANPDVQAAYLGGGHGNGA